MRKMIYINLDEAVARREAIEANLRPACEAADLALVRLPATSAKEFADLPPGPLSPAALACWQSHARAIEMCGDVLRPAHVVEDDVHATAQSLGFIENLLRQLSDDSWDMLFCDVCIAHPADMVKWFLSFRELRETEKFTLVDLKAVNFAGMASYLVNPKSAGKILALLRESTPRQLPIDIVMRNLIHMGKLKAGAIFPFVTTVSALSGQSQIQAGAPLTEFAWDTFRRLVWVGAADEAAMLAELQRAVPPDHYAPRELVLAELVKIISSQKFTVK